MLEQHQRDAAAEQADRRGDQGRCHQDPHQELRRSLLPEDRAACVVAEEPVEGAAHFERDRRDQGDADQHVQR
jgi:hypothetical protein